MPQDVAETWGALLKVHAALVPRFDRELQEAHGLPLTWYDVLLELNAAPERRLTMGQLGSVAAVSRTRVSRVVDELRREPGWWPGSPTRTTVGRRSRP